MVHRQLMLAYQDLIHMVKENKQNKQTKDI